MQAPEDGQVVAAHARSAWARLIHKVYEVEPFAEGAQFGSVGAYERVSGVAKGNHA